ncbi:hypothetical protein M2119_000008 [Aurantimicrobium minutum]|uniref:alpha-1,2-fucosyltransferase n=1 Tax=Aurantimicrobium minutum TaxID=708131 RepID=UPI002476AA66|nr:alpha-1,2-fucosyltransferase [Aurantimicrobium minutum]MDH6531771.1 hypothetical protein [Aurantimicrobium minutum]
MLGNHSRSNAISVELQGGAGNQLFQLAAGLSQAKRLEVPLTLDTSKLDSYSGQHVSRDLEIAPLLDCIDFPISFAGRRLSAGVSAFREAASRIPGTRYFKEPGLDYSNAIEKIRPGTILSGYFQSPFYFTHGAEEILTAAFSALSAKFDLAPSKEVFMHIRRGDYLLAKHQNHHGVASLDYFDRGAELIRAVQPKSAFRVFTDSPEQIPQEFLKRWDATLDQQQLQAAPLEALLMLAENNGLIMSNSSFSWWAAWISSQRSPEAVFIAPRPWLAGGSSAHTLLPGHWLTLGA